MIIEKGEFTLYTLYIIQLYDNVNNFFCELKESVPKMEVFLVILTICMIGLIPEAKEFYSWYKGGKE